ncbi:hypothetical protein ACLOJK_028778 [Asimina triloba]
MGRGERMELGGRQGRRCRRHGNRRCEPDLGKVLSSPCWLHLGACDLGERPWIVADVEMEGRCHGTLLSRGIMGDRSALDEKTGLLADGVDRSC